MVFWKTFLRMSGTEDSSQDDWEMIMLLIFGIWTIINNHRYTDIITNTQLEIQITDREKWDLTNYKLQGVQVKLFQT